MRAGIERDNVDRLLRLATDEELDALLTAIVDGDMEQAERIGDVIEDRAEAT